MSTNHDLGHHPTTHLHYFLLISLHIGMSASIAVGAPSGGPLVTLLVATIFIIIMFCFFFFLLIFFLVNLKHIWENFVRKDIFMANQSSLLTLILHEIVWVLSILLKLKFLIDYFIRYKPEGVPKNQIIFLLFAKLGMKKKQYSIR